jgi:adenylate cyclase
VAHPDRTKVIKHEHLGPGSSAVVPVEIIDLHDPVLSRMLEEFDAGKALSGEIETEQKGYLWRVTPMEREYAADEYVAVTAPVRDFTEPIARTRVKSLMFTAVAFLLAVPVIAYASHRISKPLKRLVGEAEAIRRLELDEPIDVTSHITEINDLAKAMAAMKTAVQTFGRYVPKTLVKRVIGAQVLPILGGERRELTIMFTDVADFTTLSENISAEELMLQVSQYFREMGGVITENHGTIDKYIGDAIMAFWNAPDEDDKHAEHACAAALMARRASGRLNEAWRGRGKPAMITRFGLHAADVVVGNVGSHDRMNYTAIGRAVNTASRLEGLNKHYGTRVLVSGAVAGRVRGRFLLRPVDMVIPKGSADPVQVFELLGAKPDNDRVPPEIKSNREDIRFCSIWDEAYDLYTSRRFAEARERFAELLELRPGDGPAKVFEARSAAYAADPPGDDWTGVEEFKVK